MHAIILASFVLVIQRTSSQDACADVLSTDDSLSAEFDQGTVLLQMQMQHISVSQQASDNTKLAMEDMLDVSGANASTLDVMEDIRNKTELIAEMTAIREKNDIILFMRKVCHPYPKREPIFFRIHDSKADVKSGSQVQVVNMAVSFIIYVITFLVVGMAVYFFCNSMQCQLPERESLIAERGSKCWIHCGFISVFLFSGFVFVMTLFTVVATNAKIEQEPTRTENIGAQTVTATSYVMNNLGLRCVEAAQGCVLSCALAAVTMYNWRHWESVNITGALLIQFFVRGATLAILITTLTEFSGLLLVHKAEAVEGSYHYYLYNFLDMLVVGFTEEGSKLAALVSCAYLSARTLENVAPGCWPRPCMCRVLCESPRAFMLAGLAVGYGFMTVENGEYMTAIVSTPVTTYSTPDTSAADTAAALRTENVMAQIMTLAQIGLRIFLNIHPWLVGVSAARILMIVWTREPDISLLGFTGFMWAVYPSALAHCLYDFLVSVGPTVVQLLTPFVVFFFSRRAFYHMWTEAPPEPKIALDKMQEPKLRLSKMQDAPISASEAS